MRLASVLLPLSAVLLLGRAAAAEPGAAGAASEDAAAYALRARGVEIGTLLSWVAEVTRQGRNLVVDPGLTKALSLDVERSSVPELQQEVIRRSGAGTLALRSTLLVAGPARLAAARENPLFPRLARGGYHGRRVSVNFRDVRLAGLLRMVGEVARRSVEVADGVDDQRVTLAVTDVCWDEILDALAVSAGLVWRYGDAIRFARPDDGAPRYAPAGKELAAAPRPDAAVPSTTGCFDRLAFEDVKLVAVLTGPREPQALLRLPGGHHLSIGRGTCLGEAQGRVSRVEPGRVVVEEAGAERVLPLAQGAP